eukprot:m.110634 g.110634  ORF g.110634 m.110634 type:complete len:460 (-) comp9227_c0_seq1:542-1921(-)
MKLTTKTKTLAIKFLFAVCGLSVFARSESVLLQTQMFTKCFALGDKFYPIASCTIFVPGILVQIFQVFFGTMIDRKYGTYAATKIRLTVAVIGSTIVLGALIIGSYYYMELTANYTFIFTLLVFLGLGISISFGSFVQIVSLFPSHLHPYFFIGTYSPFFIFAPVNIAIGDLCVRDIEYQWATRWNSVLVYYILAIMITIAGLLCFFGVMKHPYGRYLIELKDKQLHQEIDMTNLEEDQNDVLFNEGSSRSVQYSLSSRYSSEAVEDEEEEEEDLDNFGESEALISSSGNSHQPFHSLSIFGIALKCYGLLFSQIITTVASSLVAALYIKVKPTKYSDLPTLLIYDYYICGAIGIFLTSFASLRKLFSQFALLILSCARVIIIPLMILYKDHKLPQNDVVLIAVNSVQMLVSGFVFALCFSKAATMFQSKPMCAEASSLVNFAYYLSMAIGLGISLAIV